MSAAFDIFMREYYLTGSEKADGYSRSAFIGLHEDEKATVFEMMAMEIPWEIEWLFFLDPEKALVLAKNEEPFLRANHNSLLYKLQYEIVKYSGDLRYQQHMIEDYPLYEGIYKRHLINAVGNTQVNAAMLDFFKFVIANEDDTDARSAAAENLLRSLDIAHGMDVEKRHYDRLLHDLSSDTLQLRIHALAVIDADCRVMKDVNDDADDKSQT